MGKYIDANKLKAEIERLYYNEAEKDESILAADAYKNALDVVEKFIDSLQQEQPEISLEKFTEKMDAWKARYNHPDNIPIKAAMAFTARMFYMYPNVARAWYYNLPKATMD